MGFSSNCNTMMFPKPLIQVIKTIHCLQYAAAFVLSYFGIRTSPDILLSPWSDHEQYFSGVRDPDHETKGPKTSDLIKSTLPVVEFGSRFGKISQLIGDPTCMVCLGWLEARDEVRKLGNCCHSFHLKCIDGWVDSGRDSCPMCRSLLLPSSPKGENRIFGILAKVW